MAKKTSQNAVKQIDRQIDLIKSSNKKSTQDDTVTIDKTDLKKKVSKSSNTKSSNKGRSTSSSRDKIEIPSEKRSTNTKKKSSTSKNVRGEVVVAPQKKKTASKKKTATNSTKNKSVRGEVIVTPTKVRNKSSKKVVTNKVDPKQLNENVEEIINDIEKSEKEIKDKIDIKKSEEENKKEISSSDSKKKELSEKEYDELKLDKPINLDDIDKLEDYKIVSEFEKDIAKKKSIDNNKKSKKNLINIPKRSSYKELEADLRSLYEKVNDVVKDIDTPSEKKKNEVVDNKKTKYTPKYIPVEEEDSRPEKKSILDYISQKFLNVVLALLFIIFFIMVIAFIWFIIYVSTF